MHYTHLSLFSPLISNIPPTFFFHDIYSCKEDKPDISKKDPWVVAK